MATHRQCARVGILLQYHHYLRCQVAVRSRMKTHIKLALAAIEAKDAEKVKTALPAAISAIDRAASKGVIHSNNAARKKSFLQRQAAAQG